jgi:hypothetical protein
MNPARSAAGFQLTVIEVAKQIAYEGFKAAIAAGVRKDKAAIVVDELFGARIMGVSRTKSTVTGATMRRKSAPR